MTSATALRTSVFLALCSLAGCQILSGLNDLEEGPATASSASVSGSGGAATSSGSGGSDGEGGDAPVECMEPPASEPCTTNMMMDCAGTCFGSQGPCSVLCDGESGHVGCNTMNDATECGPPDYATSCLITCAGTCAEFVRCPIDSPIGCSIECVTPGSCFNKNITCGDGPCTVSCEQGACNETTRVACGSDKCDVSCGGAAVDIDYDDLSCEPVFTNCPLQ